MKKITKMFAVIAAMMLACSFVACSDGDDDDDTPAVTTPDVTTPDAEIQLAGTTWSSDEFGDLEFVDDTIVKFGEESGTYKLNGSKVTVTLEDEEEGEGETYTGTVSGDKITVSAEGETIVFTKQ